MRNQEKRLQKLPQPMGTMKLERKRKQRHFRQIVFWACFLVILAALNAGFSHLMGAIADVEQVQMRTWEQTIEGQAWVFQKEIVVEGQGTVKPLLGEGQRVSKGGLVALLTEAAGEIPSEKPLYSPMAGLVSYQVDGLELAPSQEALSTLEVAQIESILNRENPPTLEGKLFKVMDNLGQGYVYFKTSLEMSPLPERETAVTLRIPQLGEGRAFLQESKSLEGGTGLLLRLPSGMDSIRKQRQADMTLVMEQQQKIAVPSTAVSTKEDQTGVFLYRNGYVHWTEVQPLHEDEGMTLVEGVKENDWVVVRPWFVKDGMALKINRTMK